MRATVFAFSASKQGRAERGIPVAPCDAPARVLVPEERLFRLLPPELLSMANSTLALTPDDALSVLEYWYASAERLMLVYRRAAECVIRIEHGRVRNATACELRIDTGQARLRIRMHSAVFEFGALAPATSTSLHRTQSDGLLIRLGVGDWIFLRSRESGRRKGKSAAPDPWRASLSSQSAWTGASGPW